MKGPSGGWEGKGAEGGGIVSRFESWKKDWGIHFTTLAGRQGLGTMAQTPSHCVGEEAGAHPVAVISKLLQHRLKIERS